MPAKIDKPVNRYTKDRIIMPDGSDMVKKVEPVEDILKALEAKREVSHQAKYLTDENYRRRMNDYAKQLEPKSPYEIRVEKANTTRDSISSIIEWDRKVREANTATMTTGEHVGAAMKAPLRYMGNPLRVVGDAMDVLGVDRGSIPSSWDDVVRERLYASDLKTGKVVDEIIGATSLTYNPIGTMFAHVGMATDDAISSRYGKDINIAENATNAIPTFIKKDDYNSEFAAGIRDMKESYQASLDGDYLNAAANAVFGISGLVEIPDNLAQTRYGSIARRVDNVLEAAKRTGDLYDLWPIASDIIDQFNDNRKEKNKSRYTKAKERSRSHYSPTQFDERYTTTQE